MRREAATTLSDSLAAVGVTLKGLPSEAQKP